LVLLAGSIPESLLVNFGIYAIVKVTRFKQEDARVNLCIGNSLFGKNKGWLFVGVQEQGLGKMKNEMKKK